MASTPERTPWHRRLAARYAAALAAVALGSTLMVAVPMYVVAARLLESALDERLEGTAELVALALAADLADDEGQLEARLELLRDEADLDALFVARADGSVLERAGDAGRNLTVADREALARALREDAAVTPIQRDLTGRSFVSAFAPTDDPSLVVGLGVSAGWLDRLALLRSLFAVLIVVWGALAAAFGAWFGTRLTRPISRLAAATERIAAGGLPDEAEPGGAVELDALQGSFAAMAGAVRRRETELRALAGAVAHEVRNPSHALRLHLGLLRRQLGSDLPVATAARLATLERELDGLDATVDGFLVFARAQAARREAVDLGTVLAAAADGACVQAPSVAVNVDPLLVGRAVSNLVRNAREAGGEPVCVRATIQGGTLEIVVEDAGPGFPAEIDGRAFSPFVSGRADGTGLGLSIVAAVAAAHGGEARVLRSGPGRTEVAIRLPLPS